MENRKGFISSSDASVCLFPGEKHVLILTGSGDLYAMGNNRNDACGQDLPPELTVPVRIAQNVCHAAAGVNHSLYVTNEGEVVIVGNSSLVDRFECDIRAAKVFASHKKDMFLIEDEQGNYYFFGEQDSDYAQEECELLYEKRSESCIGQTYTDIWFNVHVDEFGRRTRFSSKVEHPWTLHSNYLEKEETDKLRRTDEYRDWVKQYGEENLRIEAAQAVVDEVISTSSKFYNSTYNLSNWKNSEIQYKEVRYHVDMQVVRVNKMIYKPQPLRYSDGIGDGISTDFCWPTQLEYIHERIWEMLPYKPEKARCQHSCDFGEFLFCINAQNELFVYNYKWPFENEVTAKLSGVSDCVMLKWNDLFLLVKDDGRLFLGDLQSLGKENWEKRLTALPFVNTDDAALLDPTCGKQMAMNVRRTSAGAQSTIYVSDEGKVRILGDESWERLFSFEGNAYEVLAHPQKDAYAICDQENRWYFAGDREVLARFSTRKQTEIPLERAFGMGEQSIESYADSSGASEYNVLSPSVRADDPAMLAAKQHPLYLDAVEKYGEKNISLSAKDIEVIEKLSYRFIPGSFTDEYRYKIECSFTPVVTVSDRYVYRPVPLEQPPESKLGFQRCWIQRF